MPDFRNARLQVTDYFTPLLTVARFGTSWEGYFDATSNTLDYIGRVAQYRAANNGVAYARGPSRPSYVNGTRLLAEFQASEANIDRFECRLDAGVQGPRHHFAPYHTHLPALHHSSRGVRRALLGGHECGLVLAI